MKRRVSLVLILFSTLMPSLVNATDLKYVACGNAEGIPVAVPQLISIVYTLLIIGTPIILIVFSIVALLKALTGGSADDIKKAKNKLIKKFIAAALVFFVAGIGKFVIMKAADASEKDSVSACLECMLYNSGCQPSTGGDDAYKATTRPGESVPQEPGSTPSSDNTTPSSNSTEHVNSINKIKYTIYNQDDSKWGSKEYPNGEGTIKSNGCMITAVAVISSSYNTSVTPITVFDSYRHSNPSTSIPSLSGNSFSCSFDSVSANDIKENLKKGNVVVIKVFGSTKGGSSVFTSSQHYMALIDIDSSNDKIFVGNAYSSSGYGVSGWFSSGEVLTSVQTAEVCVPAQSLIDKYN